MIPPLIGNDLDDDPTALPPVGSRLHRGNACNYRPGTPR